MAPPSLINVLILLVPLGAPLNNAPSQVIRRIYVGKLPGEEPDENEVVTITNEFWDQVKSFINRQSYDNATWKKFGQQITDVMLPKSLLQKLENRSEEKIRLIIRSPHPDVRSIPWELAFGSAGYLATDYRFSLVRCEVECATPCDEAFWKEKRKCSIEGLFAGPNPQKPWSTLNPETALKTVRTALLTIATEEKVSFPFISFTEPIKKQSEIPGRSFSVLLFHGHGVKAERSNPAALVFESTKNGPQKLGEEHLYMIAGLKRLRLAVLCACQSAAHGNHQEQISIAASLHLVRAEVVIGFQREILEQDAIKFEKALFEALARYKDVEHAVVAGRSQLGSNDPFNNVPWADPVLLLRSKSIPRYWISDLDFEHILVNDRCASHFLNEECKRAEIEVDQLSKTDKIQGLLKCYRDRTDGWMERDEFIERYIKHKELYSEVGSSCIGEFGHRSHALY